MRSLPALWENDRNAATPQTMNAIVKWVEIEGTNLRRYPPSMREPIEPLGDDSAGYLQLMNTIEDIEQRTARNKAGDAESNPGEKVLTPAPSETA